MGVSSSITFEHVSPELTPIIATSPVEGEPPQFSQRLYIPVSEDELLVVYRDLVPNNYLGNKSQQPKIALGLIENGNITYLTDVTIDFSGKAVNLCRPRVVNGVTRAVQIFTDHPELAVNYFSHGYQDRMRSIMAALTILSNFEPIIIRGFDNNGETFDYVNINNSGVDSFFDIRIVRRSGEDTDRNASSRPFQLQIASNQGDYTQTYLIELNGSAISITPTAGVDLGGKLHTNLIAALTYNPGIAYVIKDLMRRFDQEYI